MPLERLGAPIVELEPGARNQVHDRSGHEHLDRGCKSGDASADVDGDAQDLAVEELDLAGVQAGADVESQRPDRVHPRPALPTSHIPSTISRKLAADRCVATVRVSATCIELLAGRP